MIIKPNYKDEIIDAGRDIDYLLTFTDGTSAVNITGWKFFYTVKEQKTDTDANAKIAISFTSLSDPLNGKTTISIPASEVAKLTSDSYWYEVSTLTSGSKKYTLFKGKLTVDFTILDTLA